MLLLQTVDLADAHRIHADDPGAMQQVVAELTEDLLQVIGTPLLNSGVDLWRGLATFLVAWTGLRMATEGFSASQLVRLVVAVSVPRMMLHFYSNPFPGTALTFPAAIVGGGDWMAQQVAANAWSSTWEWLTGFMANVWTFATAPFAEEGPTSWLTAPVAFVVRMFNGIVLAAVFSAMGLIGVALTMLCFAQVIWAKFALGVAAALGPVLIPFLLFEPMAFLFWGWLRTMLTYSLYGVIAAAVLRVFGSAVQVATNQIWIHLQGDIAGVGQTLTWILSYVLLAMAGILAAVQVPSLAGSLVSGSAGGGGMLGAVAAVATAGKAAVVTQRLK